MYKYDTQWAPERNTKLIPLVKALILARSPGEEFTIPQKPVIYCLPTQQQRTLTDFVSIVTCHCDAAYRRRGRERALLGVSTGQRRESLGVSSPSTDERDALMLLPV